LKIEQEYIFIKYDNLSIVFIIIQNI